MTRQRIVPAVLLVLAASTLRASGPAAVDEILQVVPRDTAAVLVIEGFRGQRRRFAGSALFHRVEELPGYQQWLRSDAYHQLRALIERADRQAKQEAGVAVEQLMDDLLGQAVVLAVRPGPPDRPMDFSGVLITRAQDAALLHRTIDAINAAQRRSGELRQIRSHPHGTATVDEKLLVRNGQERTEYYALLGAIAVLSNRREPVDQAIDLRGKAGGLAGLPLYRAVRGRLPAAALATLFVAGRPLDGVLHRTLGGPGHEGARPRPEAAFWLHQWEALDGYGLALSFDPDRGIILDDAMKLNLEKLAPGLRGVVRSVRGGLTIIEHVPGTSLAMVATRLDLAAISRWLGEAMAAPDHQRLEAWGNVVGAIMGGKDLTTSIDPYLGPGAVLYVVPAAGGSPLPELVGAVQIRPGPRSEAARAGLANALRLMFNLVAAQKPRNHAANARVATEQTADGLALVTLSGGDLPAWLQPTYALTADAVVVASSAAAVRQFVHQAPQGSLAETARTFHSGGPRLVDSGQAFFLNMDAVVGSLRANRGAIEADMVTKKDLTPDQARDRLDQGLRVLGLVRAIQATRWFDAEAGMVCSRLVIMTEPAAEPATPP